MKRFYKQAAIQDVGTASHPLYHILLDGRPVKTPDKRTLETFSERLAYAIAAEWNEQTEYIIPASMPFTQWASTVLDRVEPHRQQLTDNVLGYFNTDLVFYRAPANGDTEAMGMAQSEKWDPIVTFGESILNCPLLTTTGLNALQQSQVAFNKLVSIVTELNDHEFATLLVVTHGTGSIMLALAFLKGDFSADTIYKAALVEEHVKAAIYNEDFYGAAPDQEKRMKTLAEDLHSAKEFLNLLTS